MKHDYQLLFLIFCTCVLAPLHAQQTTPSGSITGRVLLGDRPAEFTNLMLLAAADSSVVKLELAGEDGTFRFSDIGSGDYFLRTSGIGMAEVSHPLFSLTGGQQLTLPDYRLSSDATQLETVEVTARKPFLEQRAGRLIVNVDQSITGQGGSVQDLLKKVPGVVVAGNRISLAGRSGLTILIDGRPTRYMDVQSLLRDMPADNIKSIEVISQPGAEYDAEGNGGVINIILKKNALLGTNGSVYVSGGYGERYKVRSGLELSHRAGPLNVSGGLSYSHSEWVEGLDLVRRFSDRYFVQNNEDYGTPDRYATRLGVDYDLNENQRIGISGRYNWGQNPRFFNNTTQVFSTDTDERIGSFTTTGERTRDYDNLNVDGFYRIKLDTNGQELNLDASLSRFTRDGRNSIRTVGADFPDRVNLEPTRARIVSAQADYKKPFSQRIGFKAGAKVSRAELDNELISRFDNNGSLELDTDLSNHFLYDEDIMAVYTGLSYDVADGISANLGLRYERTSTAGYNETIDSLTERNYSSLFPSLSVSAPVSGPFGLAFSYSYRLERPSYYDLDPFISYLDPLTFEKGNPFLQPEYVHSTQLSLTYEKQPFLNLGYDLTTDVISDVTEQDATTGAAFQTTVNLDRYVRYGGSLFFPLDWIAQPISGYGGVMAYYNDYTSEYLGGNLDLDRWSVTAFLQVQAKLPMGWKGEVTGFYQGAGYEGIIAYEPLYGIDVGLEKDFWDDRLNLALSGENLIRRFFNGQISYQEQDLAIVSSWEAPVFYAKATYKFGNRFLKGRDNRKSSSSEERNRLGD